MREIKVLKKRKQKKNFCEFHHYHLNIMDFQCFIYIICTFVPMKIVHILLFYLVIGLKAKAHYSRNILNRFFILFSPTCTIYITIYFILYVLQWKTHSFILKNVILFSRCLHRLRF